MRRVALVCLVTGLAPLWSSIGWAQSIAYSEAKVGFTTVGADLTFVPPCYAQLTLNEGSAEARCQADSGTPFLWNVSSVNGNPSDVQALVRDRFSVAGPGLGVAADVVVRVRITGVLTVPLTGVPLDPGSPFARIAVSAMYVPVGWITPAQRHINFGLRGYTIGPELTVTTDGQWTTDHNSTPTASTAGGFGQVVFANHLVQFRLADFPIDTGSGGASITWQLGAYSSGSGVVADFYGTMKIDVGSPFALASGDEIVPLPDDSTYRLGEMGSVVTVLCFTDGFESGDTDQWSKAVP